MAARTPQPDGPSLQKRRSDRVYIRIPLSILGTDQGGHDFDGRAVTEMVSRFGASIVTDLTLSPEQEVILIPADKKRIRARVIGQTGISPDGHVYGIAFLNMTIDFWGIHFPPIAEAIPADIYVECCSCGAAEVVRLHELEFEVFRANDRLKRLCSYCGEPTIWRLAKGAPRPRTPLDEVAAAKAQAQRMYSRIRVNMKACIAKPGSAEDIVNTINMSRGGVLVRSERVYPTESWVRLAVPYTPAAANIFVPARIVWHGEVEGAHQYGLKYLRS